MTDITLVSTGSDPELLILYQHLDIYHQKILNFTVYFFKYVSIKMLVVYEEKKTNILMFDIKIVF